MLRINNKVHLLLILVAALLAFGATACNTDDDGKDPNGTETQTGLKKDKILPEAYEHYVKVNIETEASEYLDVLKKTAKGLCTDGKPVSEVTCKHHEDTLQGQKCLELAWFELTEYATKRLQIFNYLDFQKVIYPKLDNREFTKANLTALLGGTENIDSAKVTEKGLDGLAPLEAVIFGTPAPAHGNRQCEFIVESTANFGENLTALQGAWGKEENKKKFYGETPEKGIKALFESMDKTFKTVVQTSLAEPAGLDPTTGEDDGGKAADSTKTEAPNAKRGGWVVNQVVNRGPYSLYKGDYKDAKWTNTIQAYIKSLDGGGAINNKIDGDYKKLIGEFDKGLLKDAAADSEKKKPATKSLETDINNNNAAAIKEVILLINGIAGEFKAAADKIQ